jgi:hypothetical protein
MRTHWLVGLIGGLNKMHVKHALFHGAALGVFFAAALSSGAQADTVKTKKHHHAVKAAPAVDHSAEVQNELNQLREQVEALKAWRDNQAASEAQSQAQLTQVKAQLAEAQAQAQAAQAKVDAQIETIPGVVNTAVAKVAPKTDKLYYKGISITPGGFLAMETVYRNHQEGADIGSTYSGIPLPNVTTAHSPEDRFSARQSRLSLLAQGDVGSSIHLSGYYEMDFLGAAQSANSNESNSYNPRIRVLYSDIDWNQDFGKISLLAGQSWSLITMYNKGLDPRSEQVPLTIDAQYVVGFNWARQPGIRLTASLNDGLTFAASVENPQTTFFSNGKFITGVTAPVNTIVGGSEFNSANSLSLNKYPDVIGKVAYDNNIGGHSLHVEATGIVRDFYAQVTNAGVPQGQDTTGGGAGGGAILNVVPKYFDVQISGLVGRGIGRYGSGQLPDASFGVDGQLHPIQEWQLMAGGIFHAGPRLDVYGYAGEEREGAQDYSGLNGKTVVFNGIGNPNYDNTGCEVFGNTANCIGNTHYLDQIIAGFWHKAYTGSFGRLQWGVQYSYTERHIFSGFGTTGQIVGGDPTPSARENMILTSIRYYPF